MMASSFASKEDQNSFRWTEFPTNADDIGAALDLLVDALQRVRGRDLRPVFPRKVHVGEHVVARGVHQGGELGLLFME